MTRWWLLVALAVGVSGAVLNVHIVPHTHDDVGWLKTVDQYYYGLNNSIQYAGVQYIIDNVVSALAQNPDRTFIYVETAFFARWWSEQTASTQELVQELVTSGQLEFISGGWCMNDEATAHYIAILDQMTLGHRWLLETFGVTPRIAWQIDPFGHSVNLAGLFALMGFDALFFARLDYQDYAKRHDEQNLEFIWRGTNAYTAPTTDLFTSIFHSGYGSPSGMWYESGDDPVADDPKMLSYNVDILADNFYNEMMSWSTSYKTNNLLVPFGSDFLFQNADMEYKNMEKLMTYIQANPSRYPNINIFYSTPSRYVEAVNAYQNTYGTTWSVKTDDFFPYADSAHSFWTGYFTSRPAQKGFTQSRTSILHTAHNLYTLAPWASSQVTTAMKNIKTLEAALGVGLHHDGITGTEKQHVCDDYCLRLDIGTNAAYDAISNIAGIMVANATGQTTYLSFCPLLNVSVCPATSKTTSAGNFIPVVLYNTLSWSRTEYVRFPVPSSVVQVLDSSLQSVSAQVFLTEPSDVLTDDSNKYTVVFKVTVPPMGYATYFLSSSVSTAEYTPIRTLSPEADYVVKNEYIELTFDGTSGMLKQVRNMKTQVITQVAQNFMWYKGSIGNLESSQASGAYIFRPTAQTPNIFTSTATVSIVSGSLVTEVRQTFNTFIQQTYRIYTGQPHVEVFSTVGPIEIADLDGKEVITKYTTNLDTSNKFYTDSNGMEMQERILDYRPTWDLTLEEPVAGNYYPIVSAAAIKDATTQLTVIVDRAEGTSSLSSGELEIMLHRRLLKDDSRGVDEALNENTVIRATHYLVINDTSVSARQMRRLQHIINNPFTAMFGLEANPSTFVSKYKTSFTPLRYSLPDNALIEGILPLDSGEVVFRLQNTFGLNEDSELSKTVSINLDTLFTDLVFVQLTETQITGNQALSSVKRLSWNTAATTTKSTQSPSPTSSRSILLQDRIITLNPMQLRTFRARLAN
ncbi:lysosomal alphamannosidase [Pelomyxa schiedti]|nr:lysosomal alphamannosidase [Pelomyxa schiedti]